MGQLRADPGTRDATIAAEIETLEGEAERLVRLLGTLHEHALMNDAPEHAEHYEQVQGCLAAAAKQLGRAADIMLNGGRLEAEHRPPWLSPA
jgi:hypothetical protein